MVDPRDIYSLTDFQRNVKSHLKRLKKTGRPAVLTLNGEAALVIQDATAYSQGFKPMTREEYIQSVQEGIDDVKAGRVTPLEQFAEEMQALYGKRRRKRSA